MVERHRITVFYTAPTAIRAFIRAGDDFPTNTIYPRCVYWHCRRTNQPRGVDVVPRSNRQTEVPHCRHVVANGNGWHHVVSPPGCHTDQTRQCNTSIFWSGRPGGQ